MELKSNMYKIHKIFDCEDFIRLTNGIRVAQCMKLPRSSVLLDQEAALQAAGKLDDLVISDTLCCSSCNSTFKSKQHQRLHYKLDWHRYNLRQQLAGLKPVSEDKFFDLADDISSISGSESDTDTEQDEGSPFSKEKLNKLHERRFDLDSSVSDTDGESSANRSNSTCAINFSRYPKVFFENADGNIFSLYRCLLHGKKDFQEKDEALISLALKSTVNSTWAVIMLGGGHFAAGVFRGKDVLIHKTFHSYTVRARQGGSQSTRDNRSGGSHPKSAGASLRRYNEASFMQHVQDIFENWSSHLAQCGLIFYRAVGHNRGILFGGRNAPLSRDDTRLRCIPFPTRRATFKEVKRVHDVLSTLEVYGPALDFTTTFPQSPRHRRISENCSDSKHGRSDVSEAINLTHINDVSHTPTAVSTVEPKLGLSQISVDKASDNDSGNCSPKIDKKRNPKIKTIDRAKPRKSPHRPLPDIVTRLANISDSDSEDVNLVYSNVQLSLTDNLEEFHDTVPQHVKQRRRKGSRKNKAQEEVHLVSKSAVHLKKKLLTACRIGDTELLDNALYSVDCNSSDKCGVLVNDSPRVTKEELLYVLNYRATSDECNTLLHVAARGGFAGIVRKLLECGSEPSILNKRRYPPYVLAPDKETRNVFRRFMGEFPERYDYSKSQIPSPLTEDLQQRQCDKRKEIRKTKREKEKQKKHEEYEKRQKELERDRYLALSDSEKRGIAAEQKCLLQLKKHENLVPIIIRCFECAADITKLVPFEYDENLFCTMNCLKLHRQKGPPTKEI